MIDTLRKVPGALRARAAGLVRDPWHMLERLSQARRHGRDLEARQDRTERIAPGDVLLFCTLRNEAVRIPAFLAYYRALGVRHFLFVDNGSTDGFQALVEEEPDVSVWFTEASYRDANFGMHWLNALLARHGCGHWCVTCDPDEFLVYPHCDQRSLQDLGAFLESEHRRSLCCVMLDMYGEGPVDQAVYTTGDDPFEIAPCFDGTGYAQKRGWLQDVYTQGGVRRRVFFRDIPEQSPALNKTPFVKWRWSYSYFLSMHQLVPGWLNRPHDEVHHSPTGCVMHFKYFHLLKEKVAEELDRGEHWDDSFEYRRYDEQLDEAGARLVYEDTERYRDWRQLVELGFMNPGHWF